MEFAYLTPGLDLPFWRYLAKGVEDEAQKAGHKATTYDSNNDAAKQLANAQDAIARGVKGIIISPTDSSTCPKVLDLAAKAGIPVVIADIGTDSGEYVSFVISDNFDGAYKIGQHLAEKLKAKNWNDGPVGLVTISLARANGQKRTAGFRKAMEEAGIKEVALKQMQSYTRRRNLPVRSGHDYGQSRHSRYFRPDRQPDPGRRSRGPYGQDERQDPGRRL